MSKAAFDQIMEGLRDMRAHIEGDKTKGKVTTFARLVLSRWESSNSLNVPPALWGRQVLLLAETIERRAEKAGLARATYVRERALGRGAR